MKFRLCLLAAAAFLAPAAAHAGADYIQNGSFSTTSTTSSNGNFELTSGGTYGTVANWSTSNGPSGNPYNLLFTGAAAASMTSAQSVSGQYSTAGTGAEYLAGGYNFTSPVGGNFMALDGDPNVSGYLTQTVGNGPSGALTVGKLYELDFYWAAAQIASRTGATTEQLQVSFGNTPATTTTDTTNVLSIPSAGFSGWVKQTYYFTANAATETLSFLSIGTPAGYPPVALLDGVSLTAAPEPSTIAVLATGLGALAFFGRRRRPSNTSAA